MWEHDQLIAQQVEQAGVRMASGQHITMSDTAYQPCPARPYAEVIAEIQKQGRNRDRIEAYAEKRRRDADRYDADPWIDRHDHYDR